MLFGHISDYTTEYIQYTICTFSPSLLYTSMPAQQSE